MELVTLRDAREPAPLCGICGQPAPGHADGLHPFTVDVGPVTTDAKDALTVSVDAAFDRPRAQPAPPPDGDPQP